MRTTILATGLCALALTGTVQAQDENPQTGDAIQLDTIVVTTPLRRASSLERSTSSVTVIDEEEIRKSAASDLPQLLKSYTGVSVKTDGGMGASASVSLRGTTASQTLFLVNGVRITPATLGIPSVFNIPLDAIERIEIAKGAHSAQYGSDAIGGVINIITRQGKTCSDGRDACGSATAGVMHPWGGYITGNLQGQKNDLSYSAGGSLIGTRGYDFTTPDAPYGVHEPDDDGFRQGSLHLSLSREANWGRIYGNGLLARANTQYDGADNEQNTTSFAGKVGALFNHTEDWASTIELSSGIDDQKNFRKGAVNESRFKTTRYGIFASTEKGFETGKISNLLTGGVEAYREKVDLTTPYDVNARTISSVFGQYSSQYEGLRIDTGIRYDHNEQFGGATTHNIGASYEILPDLVLRSSYGSGFRAPTFNDLYWPGSENPDLKPEKSQSWEIGLRWDPTDRTSIDLAVYQNNIRNQINWAPTGELDDLGWEIWKPNNIDKTRISGIEASVSHRFGEEWSGKVSIDLREPLNLSAGAPGRYIAYSDRFKATAEITYAPGDKLEISAKALYGASRYIYNFSQEKLPDYVTADFTAFYAIDANSRLKFVVENIFDEQYQTNRGYRAPGRTFDLSFTRSF